MKILFSSIMFLLLIISLTRAQDILDKSLFQTPPQSSKIHTWWHWMDGNITKEGISKDLESMKKQGVVETTIFNIGKNYSKEVDVPKVKFNSTEWIEMFQWALKEAKRIGITIGIQTIDGYCTTGGPFITPELSMKQCVWTKTAIDGGKEVKLELLKPLVIENIYRDVAVVAFPIEEKSNSFLEARPIIKVNKVAAGNTLIDGNPKSETNIKKGDVIDVSLNVDFTANKLVIFPHLPF